jgi:hypothetical protein
MKPVSIADKLDKLADTAALIAVATTGIKEINDDNATSALIGLAWEMRDQLKKLSDDVLPNGGLKDGASAP